MNLLRKASGPIMKCIGNSREIEKSEPVSRLLMYMRLCLCSVCAGHTHRHVALVGATCTAYILLRFLPVVQTRNCFFLGLIGGLAPILVFLVASGPSWFHAESLPAFCDLITETAEAPVSHACFDSPGTPALSSFHFEDALKLGTFKGTVREGDSGWAGGSSDSFCQLSGARGKEILFVDYHISGDVLKRQG